MNRVRRVISVAFLSVLFCAHFAFCSYIKKNETPIAKYLRDISLTEETSGIESIDCIYVINLDKRPEKLAQVKAEFEKAGLHLNRVRGVEGWLLTEENQKELVGPYKLRMKPGEYGCLLSHVSIYKDAYERGFSRIWILEDDALILHNVKKIPVLLKELSKKDPNWDVFYTDSDWRAKDGKYRRPKSIFGRLDQHLQKKSYFTKRTKISKTLQKVRSRWGTHSYIVSRKGLEKFREYFFHTFLWCPIDWDIHFVPKIRQYSSRQDIVSNPRDRGISDTLPTKVKP